MQMLPQATKKEQQRILIVDDQSYNIDALLIILGLVLKLDVDNICDKAQSGEEAIEMVNKSITAN